MFRGYRCIIVAAFGWLSLGGQSPRAERVASPTPTPNEQAGNATQYGNGNPGSFAVTLVESPEQTIAGERRQAESREHDAKDLDAQIRAAKAAENQVFPAWLGATLSGIGTMLIVWTLALTRKANAISLHSSETQGRPYVLFSGFDSMGADPLNFDGVNVGEAVGLIPKFRNSGVSPAIRSNIWVEHKCCPKEQIPVFTKPDFTKHPSSAMGPGVEFCGNTCFVFGDDLSRFHNNSYDTWLYGRIDYEGITFPGKIYTTEFCVRVVFVGREKTPHGARNHRYVSSTDSPQNSMT